MPAPILRDPRALPDSLARPALAIGNFDGVHRGHRAVIDRALAMGRALGRPAGVLTFEPHPAKIFRPDIPLFRLTPDPLKAELLAATGVDLVIVLTFDRALAATSADAFEEDLLARDLGASGVVAGYDFHYGKGRAGSPRHLEQAGARLGFPVEIIAPVALDGPPVSSSLIRDMLRAGDVAGANAALGHRWAVRGPVAHGDKRGRDLGFPTANILLDPDCGLRHGIYAVRAAIGGKPTDGVASFGRRPTFDDGAPRLEIFFLDWSGDLYGKTLTVEFHSFIRGEEKFARVEDLIARMHEDVKTARAILAQDAASAR